MNPIRVHLGPMPEMLRTIMTDLLSQAADFVIVGESARNEDSLPSARKQAADILITQDCTELGDGCLDLVLADAPIGIFALAADGRSAAGVTLQRRGIQVESEGRLRIVEAIRQMASGLHSPPRKMTSSES